MLPNISDDDFFFDFNLTLEKLDRIEGEVGRLLSRCATFPLKAPDCEDDEWEQVMLDLLDCLPEHNEIQTDLPLTRRQRETIAWQCSRVLHCIQESRQLHGSDYDPTPWCLVPKGYRDRMSFLVGQGMVPLTWVALANALAY